MNVLVDMDWLAARLGDANIVVLDATLPTAGVKPPVDTRARYLQAHIPGAVFFDINAISDHATSVPHMLPSPAEFAQTMGAMGVGSDMTVVVYEQTGVYSAARARWMLRTMGVRDVFLLNGDFAAWQAAGYPVESGEVTRAAASFTPKFDPGAVTSYDELREKLAAGGQVIDARSAGRFTGEAPEPRPELKSGHMPGAVSVPYTDLAENGKLKSAESIRAEFAKRGIDLSKPITTTCGSGVTAAVLAAGLEMVGAKEVSLYDGSWAEYASRPESVIERSVV